MSARLAWAAAALLTVVLTVGTFGYCAAASENGAIRAGHLRLGIAYGNELASASPEELTARLDTAVELGVNWVRIDLNWADVQPTGDTDWDWSRPDRIVSAASERGLTVLPVVAFTPAWARRGDCDTDKCAPRDPGQFAAFAAAAARRYAPRGVHAWEVWNEPNSAGFWSPGADPAAYATLLTDTATALHTADGSALVISGGLSMSLGGGGSMDAPDFLSQILAAGAGPAIDAVAIHPYTYPSLASQQGPWKSPWRDQSGLPIFRDALRAAGKGGTPIWITEYGAPTGGRQAASSGELLDDSDHVTEDRQATIASDAVATAASDPGVGALVWYTDRDTVKAPPANESFYGLIRDDGSRKPAFDAFAQSCEGLR